jgi:predicted acetyltransferase
MDIEIRTIRPDEFEAWRGALASSFSEHPRDDWLEIERKLIEPERTFGALDDGRFVGGASTATMRMTVPGGEVPVAGVTGVGVAPTHRRRGVATALMRRQLDSVRERNEEPFAALHASEGGIYGRYGYGMATFGCSIEIDRDRTAFLREPLEYGRVRLLDRDAAFGAMRSVYDGIRSERPGFLRRSDVDWAARFVDFEADREGASALFFAAHEGPQGVDAYAAYRFKHDWSNSVPDGVVDVDELLASTPEAFAIMWRFVFDVDLAARIKSWLRPIDDPLVALLAEPRRLRLSIRDGLWVRIVDVPTALEARRYAADDSLVLDVRDAFCPWNEGRYLLEAGQHGAACSPSRAAPDLVLGASELGAAYLGGAGFGQLARAGRVQEETAGALARADGLFRWDPAPFCPDHF